MLRLTLYITGREGADQKPGFGYRSPLSPTPATPSSVNNNTKNTYMDLISETGKQSSGMFIYPPSGYFLPGEKQYQNSQHYSDKRLTVD